MSRLMQALEEAENGYVEEIDALKQIRDNLMEELRATRQQLATSTSVCSRNTYMLGLAIAMLRERGVSDEEIKKTLGIAEGPPPVTDTQIADLKAEAEQAYDLDQVALCYEALGGNQEAREKCAKAIHNARMANTDKETPTDGA